VLSFAEMQVKIDLPVTIKEGPGPGVDEWVVGLFIGCMLRWHHLVNACKVKAHLIGCWQNLGAVCFWQLYPLG